MSIYRLPNIKNLPEPIDDYFATGERVYKFDNITDQFEGRFVHLSLSDDGLLLFWKEYRDGEVVTSESCYIDDIIDVFSDCCAENSRRQEIHKKRWHNELRRLSIKALKELSFQGCFYYWQRLFTKIKYSTNIDQISINDILDSVLSTKNKEDRRDIEKSLKTVAAFRNKETISVDEITSDFIFSCYCCICERTDVDQLFHEKFEGKEKVDAEHFAKYLKEEHYDPRLNELLYPLPTLQIAQFLIKEMSRNEEHLTKDSFLRFLLSEYNIGYQVNSKSSVEMYRYVLLSGCRSVELDCWNGSGGEPIITHGPSQLTRVTPVLFKDVIVAIAETAFVVSEFPVILSLENHCSLKQQKKIATYCREIFGNFLLTEPLNSYPIKQGISLPSPNALRKKILIKIKKSMTQKRRISLAYQLHRHHKVSWKAISVKVKAAKEVDSKAEETTSYIKVGRMRKSDHKTQLVVARELSDLVNYMRAMGKFTSFKDCENRQMSSEMFSMNESRAYELVKQNPIEFVNHNKRQITRVYPKGKRVDSSNFWPIKFWNCGCQMTAINMQTPDIPFQMNAAFFEQNGRSGYVPKPSLMRKADAKFNPFETQTMDLVVPAYLSVTIISAQLLSFACEKRPSTYVEVNFMDISTTYHDFRSENIGRELLWIMELIQFIWTFVKKIVFPAMASIRLAVYEDNGHLIGYCFLHVRSIQPGFRHIPLRNAYSHPLGPVSLFVLFLVHDYIDDGSNPIEAMKKKMESEEATSAALINPIDTMKQREKMLLALEESEPQKFRSLSIEPTFWNIAEEGKNSII
ncbi:Phosphoinositide phospholipase C [Dirofilaria immitis]|nr:Phosphoinositide phospholipase C [Dirofilaria immitis]